MKPLKDDKGNTIITLPVSKTDVAFRPAKGRDLIRLENLMDKMQKDGVTSNIEVTVEIAAFFIVDPAQANADFILDLDPVDTMEVVRTVNNFPFIRALQKQ